MNKPSPRHAIRPAILADKPLLEKLIAESARGLVASDYTPDQIEAALLSAWGVDTQLIKDKTYFLVESTHDLIACGGWSYRKTLFGSDSQPGRAPDRLDPRTDAARIRAFFVKPEWSRQGIATGLLRHCEMEARKHGFSKFQLVATLPGKRFYERLGYVADSALEYPLAGGISIPFVPMKKV